MNKRNILRALGAIYLIFGSSVLVNSFQGITGFVVYEYADVEWGGFLGIVFVLIGVFILQAVGREEGELELDIVKTRRFEKAIRGHDINEINRAISKIGKGLGHEHHLKGRDDYAIRTSHGGRIIFGYENAHRVKLKDYTASHDYKRH